MDPVVGEVVMTNPMMRFTKDKVEPKQVKKDSAKFDKLADDFMPLKINRFEIQKWAEYSTSIRAVIPK